MATVFNDTARKFIYTVVTLLAASIIILVCFIVLEDRMAKPVSSDTEGEVIFCDSASVDC